MKHLTPYILRCNGGGIIRRTAMQIELFHKGIFVKLCHRIEEIPVLRYIITYLSQVFSDFVPQHFLLAHVVSSYKSNMSLS